MNHLIILMFTLTFEFGVISAATPEPGILASQCHQIDPCTINYNGEVLGGSCCMPYKCTPDGSGYNQLAIDCIEFFFPNYFDNCQVINEPPKYGCCRSCAKWKKACQQIDPCRVKVNGAILGDCCQPYTCTPDNPFSDYVILAIDCVEAFVPDFFVGCKKIKNPPKYGCCRTCTKWDSGCIQLDPCRVKVNGTVYGDCCNPYTCTTGDRKNLYTSAVVDCAPLDPIICQELVPPSEYGCCQSCAK